MFEIRLINLCSQHYQIMQQRNNPKILWLEITEVQAKEISDRCGLEIEKFDF